MSKSDMKKWASEVDTSQTDALIEELQKDYASEKKPWDEIEGTKDKYAPNYRRICPKRPAWETPYLVRPCHYLGPHNQMVLCLKEAGICECPACQLRLDLEKGGDKKGAAMLRPSVRTFLNVVHLNEEGGLAEEKIYLLGLNKLQFLGKQGTEYDMDEESDLPLYYFFKQYGDLSHVEHGRDLRIRAKQEDWDGNKFFTMKFKVSEPSPFPGSSDLLDEELIDLMSVAPALEPSEMMALIEGRASGAVSLSAPVETPALAAPAEEAPRSRWGDDDDAGEATSSVEPVTEEGKAEPKSPPQTNPKAAMERLNKHLEKK
ncbi:hypothetical protein LCGC14_0735210 [marine sediment metagenome]|uniref:Bacteriophage T4 Gp32 single-stranded DNA-binding domain-containing protein n=1 Tax=marine sediment metagenome TaxID=412755 RepID=A0A0F9STB0_9ZZZZ